MRGARLLRVALVAFVLGAAGLVVTGQAAQAACHAFTVSASPQNTTEGKKVMVTVQRDAAVGPSSVHVSTIDGTAKAGPDYTKLDEEVEFTSDTQKNYVITIADDTASEGAETFKLHLSNPDGCDVNPNYSIGPDEQVTIAASDATTQSTAAAPPPAASPVRIDGTAATSAPQTTAAASPSATPKPKSAKSKPTPESTFTPLAQAAEEDGGMPALAVAGIIVGALAAASGAGLYMYRRRAL